MPTKDLSGIQFGEWTVLQKTVGKKYHWDCLCSCGFAKSIYMGSLANKSTTCCSKCRAKKLAKHGLSTTSTYNIWYAIRARCTNKNSVAYADYGGRGIKLCPEWQTFEGFYQDMGIRPDGMSINRLDNSGDYSKDNCEWATITEQNRNTRATKLSFQEAMAIRYSIEPKAVLARKYGLRRPNIYAIQAGTTWKAETFPQMVAECYEKFGIPRNQAIGVLAEDVAIFRQKLLKEELDEFSAALRDGSLVDMTDALLDLTYVAIGTLLVMGVTVERIDACFKAIQRANMGKVRCESMLDSKRGYDFDLKKPNGWEGPEKEIARTLLLK